MILVPETPTPETIAPFGTLLLAERDGFQSLVTVAEPVGWQVALNRVVGREAVSVHRHVDTRECFARLGGDPVVLLAMPDTPEDVRAFWLTAPICLYPCVWHTTITPSGEALVLICENAAVSGETHPLWHSVQVDPRG